MVHLDQAGQAVVLLAEALQEAVLGADDLAAAAQVLVGNLNWKSFT